ncbi:MAG: tRNA lysidine(34) synthetase TilS [Bacteroidia bacterium]|nr:tRNA lysidine(34) synthetase TilS [Bacteroidia bacterium]
MIEIFCGFIKQHHLFGKNDRILLAVSGGLDSVVMLDLFIQAGYRCAIVHCNFMLRDEESNLDEEFVTGLADERGIPIYVKKFDTEEYAESNGISIQMAARKLRFDWFEEVRQLYGFDYIALAHHKDDIVETFLINISRGTGIRGITGIKPKSGLLVRPLLFATRHQIQEYADEQKLVFREDSSNATTRYARNRIRHHILPVFRQINPNFNETMIENVNRFYEIEMIYRQVVDEVINRLLIHKSDIVLEISVNELLELNPLRSYLFEMLNPYGFNEDETDEIIASLHGESGRQFFSSTHRLVKDRDKLIITAIPSGDDTLVYIEKETVIINIPLKLTFTRVNNSSDLVIQRESRFAYLDEDLLDFPLVLRKWRQGEYFRPFGMKEFKKLSDFFIDQKMSLVEKEQTWILASGDHIVWIAGHRIDDRYKVTPNSKNVLVIELVDSR